MNLIPLPNKRIRAEVIRDYYGKQPVYCFSCGNSTKALEEAGVNVTSITDAIEYVAPKDSDTRYGGVNVTSGYLPIHLIENLAGEYRERMGDPGGIVYVPCGSGETLLALSYFIPIGSIIAVTAEYAPLKLDDMSPLFEWVKNNVTILNMGGIKDLTQIVRSLRNISTTATFIDTRNQNLIYND